MQLDLNFAMIRDSFDFLSPWAGGGDMINHVAFLTKAIYLY